MPILLRHWRFLLYGFVLAYSTHLGQTFFFSLFNSQIRADFNLSHGDFGLIYLIATLASGFAIVYVGAWIDKMPLKVWTYLIAGTLLSAGVLFGLNTTVVGLTIAIFLLRLTGQGLLGHTATTAMGRYFVRFRGRALAFVGFGYPTAEFLMPLIVSLLLASMHWRSAWLVLVCSVSILLLPLVHLLLGKRQVFGELADQLDAPQGHQPNTPSATKDLLWGITRQEMLKRLNFYLLVPLIMTPSAIGTGWFFHHQHIATEKSWALEHFWIAFSGYAIASISSNVVFGVLVDRFGAQRLMGFVLMPMALAHIPLFLEGSMVLGVITFVLLGMNTGALGPTINAAWAELFGTKHLGSIKALGTSLMVVGSALAPFGMGVFFDQGVSVSTVTFYTFLITVGAISSGVILSVRSFQVRYKAILNQP